jgi:hypothetical protein
MAHSAWLIVVWAGALLIVLLIALIYRRARRHGGAMRGGVVAAMQEMHNSDAQKVLEMIVEGKAEARRPEYPDGNLPDLTSPGAGDAAGDKTGGPVDGGPVG